MSISQGQPRTSIKITPKSSILTSSITLNTSTSPIKLSEYIKDRSLCKCKNLVNLLSHPNNTKTNKFTSSTKLIFKSHQNISDLCDQLIKELQNKKLSSKKIWDEQELEQTEKVIKKCINLIKGIEQSQNSKPQQNQRSFLQTQIKEILKTDKQNAYNRSRKKSKELSSIKIFQYFPVTKTDHVIEKTSTYLGSMLQIQSQSRKSMMYRHQRS